MPQLADTAKPIVIVQANDAQKLTRRVEEFLNMVILDPESRTRFQDIRFLAAAEAPLHGVRTVEFLGFSSYVCDRLNQLMDSFRDFYADMTAGHDDDILIIVNPAGAHIITKI